MKRVLQSALLWLPFGLASVLAAQIAPAGGSLPQGAQTPAVAAQLPVARLSYLSGTLSVASEDGTFPPIDAALNMPLVAGTRLIAGENGEAEVEFADGSVLRITPNSTATVARLDPMEKSTSLVLTDGLFYLELRASDRAAYTVAAGDVLLTPDENASFRVRVTDARVEAAVLAGTVSVTRPEAYTVQVTAGESLRTDPKNGRRYLLGDAVPAESWDAWNEKRAQALLDEQALHTRARDSYAGDQGYGWADLDAQGNWYDVPGEGEVWQPLAADASFDPYAAGSWVNGPGGYAWASGYSWGWLPFRCGAWTFYPAFGWGWVPSTGCLSFGFNGGLDGGFGGVFDGDGGGYRVRNPPVGWHPPGHPVRTLPGQRPVSPIRVSPVIILPLSRHRNNGPVRIAGIVATPLPPVGKALTPQGGSAVGSSLLLDYPVRAGTHEPVFGLVSQAPVVVPGRSAVWQRGNAVTVANSYAQGRLPQPTDPPLGANGAAPLGANGKPGIGANGVLSVGGNGSVFSGQATQHPVPINGRKTLLPPVQPQPTTVPAQVPRPVLIAPRAPIPPPVRPMSVPAAAPAAPRAPVTVAAPAPAAPSTAKQK